MNSKISKTNTMSDTNINYNVVIIGTGGREAAIVVALRKSKYNLNIKTIGGNNNPTILNHGGDIVNLDNMKDIIEYIVGNKTDLVIIGPEKYLNYGLVDELGKYNINCVGPSHKLAQLETDKTFARKIITNIDNYNPKFKVFKSYNESEILSFLSTINNNFVVKNIGLCNGKGVKVMDQDFITINEGLNYCKELINISGVCLIEEKLVGTEFTLMSYTDGISFSHMPVVHDYKRLLNNNAGPQTGGMGCVINKDTFISSSKIIEAQKCNEVIVNKLQEECSELYKGIIYGSFMILDNNDIKIIEYNCRFGDPEAIGVLKLLKSDFMDICLGISNNTLSEVNVEYDNESVCVIYIVPQKYPYIKSGMESGIISNIHHNDNIICANVDVTDNDNKYKLLSSRSVAVIGKHEKLGDACNISMNIINNIEGPIYYRDDIGKNFI